MIRLGKHTITRYTFDADDNATFRIDSNRAMICEATRDEFRAIMALDAVSESIIKLAWIARFDGINNLEYAMVRSQLKSWESNLTEQVDKVILRLELD